jgi:transcriptional regulator with XRE-family HTH domain
MKLTEYREQLQHDPDYLAAEEELRPLLDLADMVLAQRLARGWSQADLAERVGTKQANISRLESGLANPSVRFLQKLAAALEARLTIQLDSEQSHVLGVETSAGQVSSEVAEAAIPVLNWPLRAMKDRPAWNAHTLASSIQESTQ